MTLEEQMEIFDITSKTMRNVLLSKGDDYANEDRLSNFKLAGSITGISPEKVALTLIAVKVARLEVLLENTTSPNNESIEDTTLDMANYCMLLKMLIVEKENGRNET